MSILDYPARVGLFGATCSQLPHGTQDSAVSSAVGPRAVLWAPGPHCYAGFFLAGTGVDPAGAQGCGGVPVARVCSQESQGPATGSPKESCLAGRFPRILGNARVCSTQPSIFGTGGRSAGQEWGHVWPVSLLPSQSHTPHSGPSGLG